MLLGAVQRQNKKSVLAPLCQNSREAKPGSEQSVPSAAAPQPAENPRCSPWPGPILWQQARRRQELAERFCPRLLRYAPKALGERDTRAGDPARPHRQDSATSRQGVSQVFENNLKARGAVCRGVGLGWQGAKEKGEGPYTSVQGEMLESFCHGRRSSRFLLTRSRKLVVLGSRCRCYWQNGRSWC